MTKAVIRESKFPKFREFVSSQKFLPHYFHPLKFLTFKIRIFKSQLIWNNRYDFVKKREASSTYESNLALGRVTFIEGSTYPNKSTDVC